eukprot:TRINITY_DN16891_c0_g1_i1.p1 TRINITY_DN16891_c0_g1~~TRINITY_DN16891_c0_g1_i1.p1  ORF type:complete len:778 (+),score=286.93 TRINITY_DN16891_c0_g1_i1:81-2414(+)
MAPDDETNGAAAAATPPALTLPGDEAAASRGAQSNAGLGYFMDATLSQMESVIVDLDEYREPGVDRCIPLLLDSIRSKTQRAQKAHLVQFLRHLPDLDYVEVTLDDAKELLAVLFVLLRRRGGCTALQVAMNHQVSDLCFQTLSALFTKQHRYSALMYHALDRLVQEVFRRKTAAELDRLRALGVIGDDRPDDTAARSPRVKYRKKSAAPGANPAAEDACYAAQQLVERTSQPPSPAPEAPAQAFPEEGAAAGDNDGEGGEGTGGEGAKGDGVELYKLGAVLRELKDKRNDMLAALADEVHWREPREDTDPINLTFNSVDAGELGTVSETSFQCAVRDHADLVAAAAANPDSPKPLALLNYLYNTFPYTPDRYITRRYEGKLLPDKAPVPLITDPPPHFAPVSPQNVDIGDDAGVTEAPEENVAIPPKPPTEDVQLAYVALAAVDFDDLGLLEPAMLVANGNIFYNVRSSAKREFGAAELLQLWYPKTFDAKCMTLDGMKDRKKANDAAFFAKAAQLRSDLLEVTEHIGAVEEQIRVLESMSQGTAEELDDHPLCYIVGGVLLTDEMLLLDTLLESNDTRLHARRLLEGFDAYGFDVAVFCTAPSLYLERRLSAKGLVFRDFTTCPPCPRTPGVPPHITKPHVASAAPTPLQQIHLKTNISIRSDIKYRFHFEGINGGVNQPVNAVVVGSVGLKWDRLNDMAFYGWPDGWDSATGACFAGGVSKISQYFSSDGYVCFLLEARTFANIGINASAWIFPPVYGDSFALAATWHHTDTRL